MQSVSVWLLIALVVGVIAFLCFFKGKLRWSAFAALPLMTFYMAFVLTITLIERNVTANPQYQLVVFWSYKAIEAGQTDLKAEIFWNVILFIPIGILLSMLLSTRREWLSVIFGLMISSGIELSQLFLHRGLFEFDDIIHNTLGTIIGYVLFLIVRKIIFLIMAKTKNI